VVVAMSGGVDSSVAAHLLQSMSQKADGSIPTGMHRESAGVEVMGLHMSNWNALDEDLDDSMDTAPSNRRRGDTQAKHANNTTQKNRRPSTFCEASEKEYADSQLVARHLSIPLHRVSFASEYWTQVFEPFVESLSAHPQTNSSGDDRCTYGVTMPNPDFGCNTFIKFGAMKDYAVNKMGADFVATGHYAQLWHRGYDYSTFNGTRKQSCLIEWIRETSMSLEQQVHESLSEIPRDEWLLNSISQTKQTKNNLHCPMLLAGADRGKDQTYFLSGVKTENFSKVIFPLGHLAKKQSMKPTRLEGTDTPRNTVFDDFSNEQSVRDIAIG
jgi:tRNA U34 2-thiouridine synthase MnmA/TrmU